MTIEKRKTQISEILRKRNHLFSGSVLPRAQNANQVIYFPYSVDVQKVSGYELKEKTGLIYITETIDAGKDVPIAYMYRFCSEEYTYVFEKKNQANSCGDGFLNLHYQYDEDHPPHTSFLHNNIRLHSRPISLDDFLDFITDTFFTPAKDRKLGLPWDSRFA